MTSRTLCRLDTNAVGPGLSIDDDGLIVTTNQNALTFARAVHGDLPVRDEGIYSVECYHWSNSRGDLSGLVSLGVSQVAGALDETVGDESLSWGYRPADGEVWNNGASVATVQATAERTCIGIRLSLSASSCKVGWYVNRALIHEETLPNGKVWVPAFSLGAAEAGDLSLVCNYGQHRFDCSLDPKDAWAVQTGGLATLYLAHSLEAFMSASDDSPANQTFGPYVLDPDKFSVRRAPQAWMHRGEGSGSSTAFSTLRLDNSEGTFNALRDADVRDSVLVVQRIKAPAGGAGTLGDAVTQSTAIIDSVAAPSGNVIEVKLKDTLARLDAPTPCKIIPPFYDESSRGRIQPIGLGSQRNVQPLLLDKPTRLYLLGDAPMTNVPLVTDGGATLDPISSPPQWTRALDGAGIALETDVQGRLSADCSSVGQQYFIPGADDVLGGLGEFTDWTSGVPDGWDEISSANGSIAQTSSYGLDSGVLITSRIAYIPNGYATTGFGYWIKLTDAVLEPGRTYRISFRMPLCYGTNTGTEGFPTYGVSLLTKLEHGAPWWITPYARPIQQALPVDQTYSFIYTVPPGAPLPIYATVTADYGFIAPPTALTASAAIDDLLVELLGQYVSVPLEGMTLTQAFREILVNRCGEPEAIFSSEDTEAIDAATGYTIGVRYEDQPNTAALLQEIADAFGAVVFTDEHNVIRVRRLTDAAEGDIVAAFDITNVDLSDDRFFVVSADDASGLTTNFACRRNQTPFQPGGFVTDTDLVPATQREQWQGTSQFRFTSAVHPAQEYAHAIGAGRLHGLQDDLAPAKIEANRVLSLFTGPRPGQLITPGMDRAKRNFVRFEATHDGDLLGLGPSVAPQQLYYGDKITLSLPAKGFSTTRMVVVATEPFPFANRIIVTARY